MHSIRTVFKSMQYKCSPRFMYYDMAMGKWHLESAQPYAVWDLCIVSYALRDDQLYCDSMANIIRSAKSGSDWGGNELMGYNTTVTAVPPHQFFLQGANPICVDITKVAQTGVCLLDQRSMSLLVLQKDRTIFNRSDPEAQVIAAYQCNNQKRQQVGLHPLDTMTMPCITMIGSRPIFYLVPVTKALSDGAITVR